MFDSNGAVATAGAADLLRLLRDGEPRTRAQIGAQTGWARATVDSRVETLRAAGLVTIESVQATGGRPSTRFQLEPAGRLVVAVDLGHTHRVVGLTDLLGRVLASRRADADIEDGPEVVLDWVVDTAVELAIGLGRSPSVLAAVGIGLPSPVEFETGRPFNPVGMKGWTDFDVPGYVSRRLHVPVLVDNDANLMALGEQSRAFADVRDLIFIKVTDSGMGAGVVAGGALQRGGWGIAGDIGHVPVPRGAGIPCECGNTGCVAKVASLSAIADAIRDAGVRVDDRHDVAALVGDGVVEAIHAVRQAGRDLGDLLIGSVGLMNPSLIVVGGDWGPAEEHLIAGIREVVYSRALPLATQHLSIVASRTGDAAALVGAGTLATDAVISPEGVEAALRVQESAAVAGR
jgi:predicted NBD/HSP70 family sugar kinase/biotin operon repressor